MQNIPVFFAQNGTATLILREIPHRQTAYIVLRTVLPGCLTPLIAECAALCRSCGAQTCLVSPGDLDESPPLPHAYDILRLHVQKERLPLPCPPIPLTPTNAENSADYQRIYNQCFRSVSHAMTYDRGQLQRITRCGHQAFLALEENGNPWGIGELHGNELAAVGLLPSHRGCGARLTLTLLSLCPGPELTLTVVSDNQPALRLYDRLGFTVFGTESSWFYA